MDSCLHACRLPTCCRVGGPVPVSRGSLATTATRPGMGSGRGEQTTADNNPTRGAVWWGRGGAGSARSNTRWRRYRNTAPRTSLSTDRRCKCAAHECRRRAGRESVMEPLSWRLCLSCTWRSGSLGWPRPAPDGRRPDLQRDSAVRYPLHRARASRRIGTTGQPDPGCGSSARPREANRSDRSGDRAPPGAGERRLGGVSEASERRIRARSAGATA